jgi:hypothetical protein
MFSCITGRQMYAGTHKSVMFIHDDMRPNKPPQGNRRSVVTYGGYLLENHGTDLASQPENITVVNGGKTFRLYRERCDYDLTTLVAQCLCEEPSNRPSMKKLLEFTTYWLRHYSDNPGVCNPDQTDDRLGPTGATSTTLFQLPVSIQPDWPRDQPNNQDILDSVS